MAKFTHELDELVANKIITPEVANDIRSYYDKPTENRSLLVVAFGIIGALLIGMGIVLIIAHNWDELSIPVKLIAGLAPMLIAQVLTGFIIVKSIQNQAWRESAAVILIFAVATAIAIVSQVYNIDGSFAEFCLTWSILILPVMYLLRSGIASLLFWMIITTYVTSTYGESDVLLKYLALAVAATPFYIGLVRKNPEANSVSFHNWVIGISITIALGFSEHQLGGDFVVTSFITLFSIFMLLGQLPVFAERKIINNAWLIGGSAGTIVMLSYLTFDWVREFHDFTSPGLYVWIFFFVTASILLYIVGTRIGYRNILSKSYTFIIFIPLFIIGLWMPWVSKALVNILLLVLGAYTIREGAMAGKLWRMNYGLLILSVLIISRFFDTDISFAIRGLLFVVIGVGFFGMNYYMIRKKKISS